MNSVHLNEFKWLTALSLSLCVCWNCLLFYDHLMQSFPRLKQWCVCNSDNILFFVRWSKWERVSLQTRESGVKVLFQKDCRFSHPVVRAAIKISSWETCSVVRISRCMKIPKFMSTSEGYRIHSVWIVPGGLYCSTFQLWYFCGNLVIMLHLRYAMMDHQRYVVLEYIFFYRVKTQDGLVNMPTFYLLLLQLKNFKGIMVLSLFVVLTYSFKIFLRWRRMLFLWEFCQKKLNYYVCFR